MNPDIAAAVAAMDKIPVSQMEHPGDWALDPSSCRFLAAFTRAIGARRVIEFGSGFSTLMMAREIAAHEGNYLLSVDDSPHYSALAREALESSECAAKVDFRVAPLRPRFYGRRLLLSYALPKGLVDALGPFDLAFVDAPHHNHGRESVFYDLFPAVAPGGYIILDDSNSHDQDNKFIKSWKAAYGGAMEAIPLEGIGNGLTVIEKVDDDVPFYQKEGAVGDSLRTLRDFSRLLLNKPE
ncbi:MAG: class I SAM-dependent methyltransferase [Elusimicrobia bacterium]|nr:class I SAM-dependent methyltransferase [Elusimicrobiota bacterium]